VELLRTARLQKGRELLQTTGKNVSEIAYEVGFTAPSYFTKCFKDEFGISPSDL
jgi:AraC-like DNA-binding protein